MVYHLVLSHLSSCCPLDDLCWMHQQLQWRGCFLHLYSPAPKLLNIADFFSFFKALVVRLALPLWSQGLGEQHIGQCIGGTCLYSPVLKVLSVIGCLACFQGMGGEIDEGMRKQSSPVLSFRLNEFLVQPDTLLWGWLVWGLA